MALINCPECKQEISNKAESCPNCGYKPKKKGGGCGCSSIIGGILIGLIVLFILAYFLGSGEGSDVITDDRTYSQSWRSPQGSEYADIGRIIVANGIKVCGEYYVKEIESNELVIACTPDGESWQYFVVYVKAESIYRANDEMNSRLKPPR